MTNIEKIEKTAELYIENILLPSDPLSPLWNCENFLFSKPPKWNYIDNCMILSAIMMYEFNGDSRLINYAVRFIDAYINDDGSIPTLNYSDYNLDNVNGAKNLIYLFKKTGIEKYRLAFESIYYNQLTDQPRLKCGNFFHKAVYPHQMWLDGTYMALPFLAEYAEFSGRSEIFSDIAEQIKNVAEIMRDDSSGLYRHGYDESRSMNWADNESGLSKEVWLRSVGWFGAALADICELSLNVPGLYDLCSNTLKSLISSLANWIQPESDMLFQLPAKPELDGNYPETSGTLLFSYAALKAFRLGICGSKIKSAGIKTLSAVTENYIRIRDDSIPLLSNICLVAGLGGTENRNGTAEYYLSEPIVENDAKGIAPYLMACTELKKICGS